MVSNDHNDEIPDWFHPGAQVWTTVVYASPPQRRLACMRLDKWHIYRQAPAPPTMRASLLWLDGPYYKGLTRLVRPSECRPRWSLDVPYWQEITRARAVLAIKGSIV